ncbi:hypothetical protein HY311_01255 [Candidatus Nomurabacteria bacterium]|nr:hypothetical protein [Candidatus Nomurabacteria bacterium]
MVPVTLKYDPTTKTANVLCSNYVVNGGKGSLEKYLTISAMPSADAYYYVGQTKTKTSVSSTLYTLGLVVDATKSTCDLRTVVTTDKDIVSFVKLPDGRFIMEMMDVAVPGGYSTTEIGVFETNGSYTQKVPPTVRMSVAGDWKNSRVSYAFIGADKKGHAGVVDEKGNADEKFNSGETPLLTVDIFVTNLSGDIALLSGSNRTVGAAHDKLVAINTKTNKVTVLSSYDSDALNGFKENYAMSAVSNGSVAYFRTYNGTDKSVHEWEWTAPGPARVNDFTANPTLLVQGGKSTLEWSTVNATTVSIFPAYLSPDPLGFLPLSGKLEITPGIGANIIILTANGPLGFDTARVTVNVTAQVPLPTITDGGIRNAASMEHTLAPRALGTVFGTNLCYNAASSSTTPPLPTTLCGGTKVLVNGQPAPLTYVDGGQINFLAPDILSGNGTVQVVRGTVLGPPMTFAFTATAPGVFMNNSLGILTDATASTVILVTADKPMIPGGYYTAWATGLGAKQPSCTPAIGEAPHQACSALATTTLTIGGVPAEVIYAGTQPDFPGLDQINFRAPVNSSSSQNVLGELTVGDVKTSFPTVLQIAQ